MYHVHVTRTVVVGFRWSKCNHLRTFCGIPMCDMDAHVKFLWSSKGAITLCPALSCFTFRLVYDLCKSISVVFPGIKPDWSVPAIDKITVPNLIARALLVFLHLDWPIWATLVWRLPKFVNYNISRTLWCSLSSLYHSTGKPSGPEEVVILLIACWIMASVMGESQFHTFLGGKEGRHCNPIEQLVREVYNCS